MNIRRRTVVIDNFDSFTYNLVNLLEALDSEVIVYRNDVSLAELIASNPSHLVISPGSGAPPHDTGVTCQAIEALANRLPILGVCLGHQAIGYIFGGTIIRAAQVMHGKASHISHNGDPLFAGIENGFLAGRYHSLVIDRATLPSCLKVIADCEQDGEIMAVRHRVHTRLYGVQFHPESILTASNKLDLLHGEGARLLENFLALS